MSDFKPTSFRTEQKGARMVAIYATVDGEEVFVGSSLNGGGFDAADKVDWIVRALESHHYLKDEGGAKPKTKKAPAKADAPAKKALKKVKK